MKYIISHDLGTSGNKATLFNETGTLIKSVVVSYETDFFNGNCAEQNPDDWFDSVKKSTVNILQGVNKEDVAAISFSGQMMACVVVDEKGIPIRNALIWADTRAVEEEKNLKSKIDKNRFYNITGHRISATYSLAKLMWIKNNEPDNYKKIKFMLNPKDYIVYKLTGKYFTDYSDASGTNCFDLNTNTWSKEILEAANIPIDILPSVKPSTTIAGNVLADVANQLHLSDSTLVVLGGGDGVCAAVGAGSVNQKLAYNYLGSSSWIGITRDKPYFDPEMRTFTWAHMVPGQYAPTGTMNAAGNSYSFLRDEFCKDLVLKAEKESTSVYKLMDEEAFSSPLGANGLIYLPYLLGERSPRWNSLARGCFIGLKKEHTRSDILRAGLEGIIFNLGIINDIFSSASNIEYMNITGGLAKNVKVAQLISDIYGIPINIVKNSEQATSIGAAICAGVGIGLFKDFNVINDFIEIECKLVPNMENYNKYQVYREVFENTYIAMLPIYKQLDKLN